MGAALWALCALWAGCAGASLLPQEEERLRASVGGYAVMNCHLDFPFGIEIPYHLQWDKDVRTGYPAPAAPGAGSGDALRD